MVVKGKGARSPQKPGQRGKKIGAAPAVPPPDGLQEALASVIKLEGPKGSANHAVPRDLPASVRRCLDVLSAREGLPKRLATVPVESPDALIEQHAKTMAGKCKRCSELLRSKYAQLEDNKLGVKLTAELSSDELAPLALIASARKSPRCLWLQPVQQEGPVQLARLFELAMSKQKQWPTALELDLAHATYSRELQLPYKDERERDQIMALHVKAQEVINQINDYSMELLRSHFETSMGKNAATLSELSRMHAAAEPDDERLRVLVRMHAALTSSTEVDGAVQTFYPLTEDEQEQLSCAVRYVQHATDFSTAQSGLFMWMHSMSIFAHSVSHRWERNRVRQAADEEAVSARKTPRPRPRNALPP